MLPQIASYISLLSQMKFGELCRTKKGQAFLLLSVSVLNILFSICINMILTRILGPENYGNYALVINIFTFSQTFFLFGFFHSGSRLIAVSRSSIEVRKYYGAEFILLLLLYGVMAVSLFLYSVNSANIEEKHLLLSMLLTIPFGWIYLLTNYYEILLQGGNEIKYLAQVRIIPRMVLLLVLSTLFFLFVPISLNGILVLYFSSYLVAYVYVIIRMKPIFRNLKSEYRSILSTNRHLGFNVYIGSLFSVGAAQLTGIIISYYNETNAEVGFFNIANQICLPLTLIPNIISTVFFKQFANTRLIDPRLLKGMIALSVLTFLFILAISKYAILFMYGPDYMGAVSILVYLSIGALFYGMADFYCKFLLAQGKGLAIRNSAIVIGIVLIVSNLVCIKYFNGVGAAVARIFSGFIYISLMYFYYKTVIVKQAHE